MLGQSKLDRRQSFYKKSQDSLTARKSLGYRVFYASIIFMSTFLLAFFSFSFFASTEDANADSVNITINSNDYTLSLVSSDVSVVMDALPGGSIAVAKDTVNVKTNNPAGYRLYLSTNNTADTSKNLYLNGTVADDTPKIAPSTGTFLSPTALSNDTWGYALSRSDANALSSAMSWTPSANFAETYSTTNPQAEYTWAGVPTKTNPQLIQKTTSANNITGVDADVYFGVKADASLKPGTYSGTILFTALPDGSMLDTASVLPNEVNAGSTASITISTSLYANASGATDAIVTVGGSACAITALSNSASGALEITCTAPALAIGSYDVAVSVPSYGKSYTITNGVTYKRVAPYMQDYTLATCQSEASSSDTTVIDRRDGNEYTVRYINDNCWMTQNLRITGSTALGDSDGTIRATDSNFTGSSITFDGDLMSGGDLDFDSAYYHNSGNTSAGVWYNYSAASAKTITGTSNETVASQDICPSGWRLPTNSEQSGIITYANAYNSVSAGFYSDGILSDTEYGFWWSSAVGDSMNRNDLYYNGSDLNTGSMLRYYGLSVRCIRKNDVSTVTYMQDVTKTIANNTVEGATATLTDKRDNQTYTVAKINGNLWMTRNLAIGCNGTGSSYGNSISSRFLSSSDSNVSTSWYTPELSLTNSTYNSKPGGWTTAAMRCSSSYGAWYNFKAAAAGSIDGNSGVDAVYDICPKNWKLPITPEVQSISSYVSAYKPVTGGRHVGGTIKYTQYGYWWSATASGDTDRLLQRYDGGLDSANAAGGYDGSYVRCIHS